MTTPRSRKNGPAAAPVDERRQRQQRVEQRHDEAEDRRPPPASPQPGRGDELQSAEADLAIRGPGDLLGTRQAGLPRFRVADLATHLAWIERARQDAREIVARFDAPDYKRLRARVEERAARLGDQLAGG